MTSLTSLVVLQQGPVCYYHLAYRKGTLGKLHGCGGGGARYSMRFFFGRTRKDAKSRWGTAAKSRRNEAEQTGLLPKFVAKPLKPCALGICVEEGSRTVTKV